MKLIRELRFGRQKCFKTGAVVGSYPKPLLCLELDPGGLDILPPRGYTPTAGMLAVDTFYEDVVWRKPEEVEADCLKKPEDLPKVTAVDFATMRMEKPNDLYVPIAAKTGYQQFVLVLRALAEKGCPWKTVVVDPATGLTELVHSHLAGTNPNKLSDTMKWSPDVGYQIIKTFGSLSILPAHIVVLMHESTVQEMDSEDRKLTVREIRPMVPSKWARERIGGLAQQYFYQQKNNGKIEVLTSDTGYLKCGLGCRWPLGLPGVVGPLYKDIYERK